MKLETATVRQKLPSFRMMVLVAFTWFCIFNLMANGAILLSEDVNPELWMIAVDSGMWILGLYAATTHSNDFLEKKEGWFENVSWWVVGVGIYTLSMAAITPISLIL